MTEREFRKKFRYISPENKETFTQFSSRLYSYLSKWLAMAKVEKTYEAVCGFMASNQFLESCNRELYVSRKPKKFKNLDEMAREADLFAEARGGVSSCVAKGQPENRDSKGFSKVEPSRSDNKPEIKCRICGKPHLTYKCWNNPDRKVASSADVADASSADTNSPHFKGGNLFNRGRGNYRGRGYGRENNRGQGRGVGNKFDNATR